MAAVIDQLPETLCKFRRFASGGNIRAKQDRGEVYSLLSGRLRFARLSSFNDPFEARPHYVRAFADEETQLAAMLEYFCAIAQRRGVADPVASVRELLSRRSMDELVAEIGERARKSDLFGAARVFCLARPEVVASPLPWSHYASSHSGICIHFSTSKMPLRVANEIGYDDTYPELPVPRTAIDISEFLKRILLRKSREWAYEKEFRVVRIVGHPGPSGTLGVDWKDDIAFADPQCAVEVTLGAKMEKPARDNLLAWIGANAPHIVCFQAKLHISRYEVERERIQ